ncbi:MULTISPECIES: hypothetical protein [Aeromicrobium]|uniref:hypothetical protein n=1 Tax=Aeromicrobium TaxID=2040 RepID=UPI00258061BC|nr:MULTISPECIES: hypothetical protein [Aeromicrobium]
MGVALGCFCVHLACGAGLLVFNPEPVGWVVVGCVAAIASFVGVVLVRAPFAKFLFAATLPFAVHLVLVWVEALQGALTDFYGLYFFYDVLPLIFFSALAVVAAFLTPTSFDSPYT